MSNKEKDVVDVNVTSEDNNEGYVDAKPITTKKTKTAEPVTNKKVKETKHINEKSNKEYEEFKKAAGDFAKAAGGMVDSFGKFASKKGSELIEAIESDDFTKKVSEEFSAAQKKAKDTLKKTLKNNTKALVVVLILVLGYFGLFILSKTFHNVAESEPEPIATMPYVVGMTLDGAKTELEDAGIYESIVSYEVKEGESTDVVNEEDIDSEWTISEQSITDGELIYEDSEITLTFEKKKVEEKSKKEALKELRTYKGKTVYEADPELTELGYDVRYYEEDEDEEGGIGPEITSKLRKNEELQKKYKITEVSSYYYIFDIAIFKVSNGEKKKKKQVVSEDTGLTDTQAQTKVLEYGQKNFDITFRLVLTETYTEESGNGYDTRGACTFKDKYGNEIKRTVQAHVNKKTGEVESFNVG